LQDTHRLVFAILTALIQVVTTHLRRLEATLKLKIEEVADAEAAEIAAKKQMVAEQMELAEEMAKDGRRNNLQRSGV
jgi:cell division protein FtsB